MEAEELVWGLDNDASRTEQETLASTFTIIPKIDTTRFVKPIIKSPTSMILKFSLRIILSWNESEEQVQNWGISK